MQYDVVIVGGGPAGLSGALALGRARKRVLLCDAGPRRNAAATHLHNFVTRDGTPPEDFRRIGREQLATYPNVEQRDAAVEAIEGNKGAFTVTIAGAAVEARRVILCTGMIDEPLAIDGFRELWGHAIFQCPYCHGWEVKDRPWGFIGHDPMAVHFALLLRSWTRDVAFFTNAELTLNGEQLEQLRAAGVRVETTRVARLVRDGQTLTGVELDGGTIVPCDVLYAHPPQRQVGLVAALGLELDDAGFVATDPLTCETSRAGIYAAGDLTTRAQAAIIAAAYGTRAAATLNAELTADLAVQRHSRGSSGSGNP